VGTAAAFVSRTANTLSTNLAAQVLHRWRANALAARVFALHEQLAAAQAEAEALLCSQRLRAEATAAYFERQPGGRLAAWTLRAALLAWQRQAHRQQVVREAWRALAEAAVSAAEGGAREPSLAMRLRQRRHPAWSGPSAAAACAGGGGLAWELSKARLLAASFGAWLCAARQAAAWRRLRAAEARLEGLSVGLPAWVRHLGDRRRLERAWLALRLASCGAAASRLRRLRSRRSTQQRIGAPSAGPLQQSAQQTAEREQQAGPALLIPAQPSPTVQQRGQPQPRGTQAEGRGDWQLLMGAAAADGEVPHERPPVDLLWAEPPQPQPLLQPAATQTHVQPPCCQDERLATGVPPTCLDDYNSEARGPAASAAAPASSALECGQPPPLLKRRATTSLLERGAAPSGAAAMPADDEAAAPPPTAAARQRQRRRTAACRAHWTKCAFGRTLSSPTLRAAAPQPTRPAGAAHQQQQPSTHWQQPARRLLPGEARKQAQQAGSYQREPPTLSSRTAPPATEPCASPVQVVCTRFLGLRDSLEAAAGELVTQTRALFSAGSDAASPGALPPSLPAACWGERCPAATRDAGGGASDGGAWRGAAGPLPLLGSVPGDLTAAHMAEWTDGLHAAARPWLRRSGAEAAAGEGAARVLGTLPRPLAEALPAACTGGARPIGPVEMTAGALQWATGALPATTRDGTLSPAGSLSAAGEGRPSQQTWAPVAVDARPPSVSLPHRSAGAAPWAAADGAAAAASLSLRAGRGEQWRVLGQPRQTLVVSPEHRPAHGGDAAAQAARSSGTSAGDGAATVQRGGTRRLGSVPLTTHYLAPCR
jgi:hypothetical protein